MCLEPGPRAWTLSAQLHSSVGLVWYGAGSPRPPATEENEEEPGSQHHPTAPPGDSALQVHSACIIHQAPVMEGAASERHSGSASHTLPAPSSVRWTLQLPVHRGYQSLLYRSQMALRFFTNPRSVGSIPSPASSVYVILYTAPQALCFLSTSAHTVREVVSKNI